MDEAEEKPFDFFYKLFHDLHVLKWNDLLERRNVFKKFYLERKKYILSGKDNTDENKKKLGLLVNKSRDLLRKKRQLSKEADSFFKSLNFL